MTITIDKYAVTREGGYVNGEHVKTWRVDWPGCSAVFYGAAAETLAKEYIEYLRWMDDDDDA